MSNAFEQSLFVFFREDLHKLLKVSRPIVENISGSLASCVEEVTIDQVFQDALVRLTEVPGACGRRKLPGLCPAGRRRVQRSQNCSASQTFRLRHRHRQYRPTYRRRSFFRRLPKTTTVPPVMYSQPLIAAAFRNRCCAGKTNGKTLTGYAVKEGFTARSSVQNRVARR